jgi:hypothetical protein
MMTRLFSRRALAAFALAAGVLAAGAALAREVGIAAFYGRWQGGGLSESEISVHFQVSSRDLDVHIRPEGDGFAITWTTIQRQKGPADNPTPVNKTTSMTFVPTGKPNVWRAREATDPLAGPFAWATLRGQTLTVNSMAVDANGGFELQIYQRTLTGNGMELDYTRIKDGDQVRTAKGRLVKYAN